MCWYAGYVLNMIDARGAVNRTRGRLSVFTSTLLLWSTIVSEDPNGSHDTSRRKRHYVPTMHTT